MPATKSKNLEDDILNDGLPFASSSTPAPVKAAKKEEPVPGAGEVDFDSLPEVNLSGHAMAVQSKIASQSATSKDENVTATGMKITAGVGVANKPATPNITRRRTKDPGHRNPERSTDEHDFSNVTMQKFDSMIMQYRTQRDLYEAKAEEAKRLKAEMSNTEGWLMACMKEHNKSSYKSSIGTLIISKRFTVALPKTLDDKRKCFEWILEQEGQDSFDGMVSINSKTFNKYYKEHMEKAFDEGDVDFSIPGVEEPKHIEQFSVRSK